MIIQSLQVYNFRSILNETLNFEQLTALVGVNGSGKSSFLQALKLFYTPSPKVEPEDFYNGNTSEEIIIRITFKDLSQEALDLFSKYIEGKTLTVEKVFACENEKPIHNYHGAILQNPDFDDIRTGFEIKDRAKTAKTAYNAVRSNKEYTTLPPWSSTSEVDSILKEWEEANPSKCVRKRDDGQFFGFREVGQGYLGKFSRLLFIQAVRDASSDAAESRGSVLTSLMDLVVRSVIANKEAVKKLQEDTQNKYNEIMDPSSLTELTTLENNMSRTLKTFVPDAKVILNWLPLESINIPMPKADVKLEEDGYSSAVERTGHGLQRAFILTMLQHLAIAQTTVEKAHIVDEQSKEPKTQSNLPSLILAIEEPELYQHPNRQRHFTKILLQLSSGKTPGVADKTQIIYSTHSPFFVGIDRISQIRLLRKVSLKDDIPKVTNIVSTDLDEIATTLWEADGKPSTVYTGQTLIPRLRAIMTPWMSEGFFADVAVLVEGEEDRAAILGVSRAMEHDLESKGISVIPCGGKTCLDRPATIFYKLGIPIYVIWDGDKGDKDANPENNHRLLRLLETETTDWPSCVEDNFACFEKDLKTTMISEIGKEKFNKLLKKYQKEFCIPKQKHAIKNPMVVENIITEAHKSGSKCQTLEKIVEKIILLCN